MKTINKSLLLILVAAVFMFSCEKEDTPDNNNNVIEGNQLGSVTLTESATLDAATAYQLNGVLTVQEGAVLTIPAGTVITAEGGTTSYVMIEQGAQILAEGTATNPIVFTSTVKEPASWGGLVICGYAPTNKPGTSEVGNKPYGGDDADDNSGVLKYVRVEYSGYNFTDEKQFNGVSLFAVGSGTTVSYVSSYNGNDDGIEFFGGTVDADHLVSINSGDDGIDFADGWQGSGSYWYAYNSTKSGIEGSNNGSSGAATPMTNGTFTNMTIYRMGEKPWFLKEGSGVQAIDNIIIGGLADNKGHAYFFAQADDVDTFDRISAGEITVTNANFVNVGAGNDVKAVEGITVGENASATGAGEYTDATTMQPTWADGWAAPSN
ncbi:MAG: hypothetical protein ABFR62_08850 [Bacteroidota bacterium]